MYVSRNVAPAWHAAEPAGNAPVAHGLGPKKRGLNRIAERTLADEEIARRAIAGV